VTTRDEDIASAVAAIEDDESTLRQVVLATHNRHKVEEFQAIVAAARPDLQVIAYSGPEPVEDGVTFAENALIKARAVAAATGLPAVADDSGLCVDALNGMPGVLSARWGGTPKSDERNNELLLHQLADVPDDRRGAHFTCVVAFCHPTAGELVVEGRMAGRVTRETRGSGGFGYDVLFVADDHPGPTTAELSIDDKDAISHRGRALRQLAPQLAQLVAADG